MAAAGIELCSRIVLIAAAVVIVLGFLAAPASAREVPDGNGGGRYELMERQRVSTQHGVPSGPNPGSNLSPPLPPRDGDDVAVEANGGRRQYDLMKQQRVSTQHDVPSGPNPGSNLSPPLPPRDVAVEANGGHRYELMKQQHVSTQHDVPSGPNPGSNLSPRLPPPRDIVRP